MNQERQGVAWLVDGFNLYHSLQICGREKPSVGLKWLNLVQLATEHLSVIGPEATLDELRYYTALPHHLASVEPARLARHEAYLRALTAWRPETKISLGHFQSHQMGEQRIWREKGTDVAITTDAMELAMDEKVRHIVIVSGDADYVPLAEVIQRRFKDLTLHFAFPASRVSRRLRALCPGSFTLTEESYRRCQFPKSVRLPSGRYVHCPKEWKRGS
jgi:uncharacterized LabA/DUF88 family protein